MAGGFLTKIIIGAILFSMVIGFAGVFMVQIGGDYGLNTDDLHIDEAEYVAAPTDITKIISEVTVAQEGADIGEDSQDTAQLQGLTSAEKKKLSIFPVLKNAAETVTDILIIHPFVLSALIGILMISLIAAIYYSLRGVMP